MKEWLLKLLSQSSGVSAMRVMSFISLLSGIIIAFVGVYENKDLSALAVLVGVFVGSAFAGKAVQKFSEAKVDTNA